MARPAKTDEKRKELLAKAVTCFTRYGYSKTTLDDVAKETGINKASLYHYFKNKDELFLQVLLQVSAGGIEALKEKAQKVKQPQKQLVFYFTERLHYYLQIVRLNSLDKSALFNLQGQFDAVYQPVRQQEITWIATVVRQMNPAFSLAQATQHAQILLDTADAIKHNAVFTGNLLDGEEQAINDSKKQITQTITLLLKGIQN